MNTDCYNPHKVLGIVMDEKIEKIEFPDATSIYDLNPILGPDSCITKDLLKLQEKADRFNEGKPKWSLVHYESLVPMIRVLEYGCLKYAPFNWMKPMDTTEILESMQRHLAALFDGEINDIESGISHMGHLQANAMFYNYHINKKNNND